MAATSPVSLFDLTDRVAVVTGGSRGLGREMVLAFARSGADVVIASRKLEACEKLAEEVRAETGRAALGVGCHVGRWADCDALADRALEHFGRVDVLVNNAGMSPIYPSLADVSEELWDKVLAVNLKGAFRLSARLGTHMAGAEGGSIINVSSIAAVAATPSEVPYGAAKAGLHNLTLSMARAFAPKVRVNCIMPGPFMTDISKAWSPEMIEGLRRFVPLGRGGEPHEICGAALYLASAASGFTTGAILKLDGGAVYPAA
ncbi:MAG: glucose 1-dehydrogenase [Myxococcota bacterium]|jgi:NAD(P)-dependent dehydrogenase (short-subunit alcohol dehydrogenase family)|nr:short-chain dehydrogenase [Deltaproteobacteria bacterium]MCP4238938.1 glucose 1-dehydrogenase [bacterium]MDP6074094.1 glucose 1-dehydrogenase [Myxococcota bacterium]MDP6243135.1 glucose 1-dehydrogenase [Myxococcota bacterium]MDP7074035.1 glucose 1-dehydrogenase [Myxococcota bacterium]